VLLTNKHIVSSEKLWQDRDLAILSLAHRCCDTHRSAQWASRLLLEPGAEAIFTKYVIAWYHNGSCETLLTDRALVARLFHLCTGCGPSKSYITKTEGFNGASQTLQAKQQLLHLEECVQQRGWVVHVPVV
jgi:hypothetical protein